MPGFPLDGHPEQPDDPQEFTSAGDPGQLGEEFDDPDSPWSSIVMSPP
jgi:hypothetical protein